MLGLGGYGIDEIEVRKRGVSWRNFKLFVSWGWVNRVGFSEFFGNCFIKVFCFMM